MNKRTPILALSVLLLLAAGCNFDDPVSLGPAVYGTVPAGRTSSR